MLRYADLDVLHVQEMNVFLLQVTEKDEETKRLQMEVEEARRQQEAASEALVRASSDAMRHNRMHNVFETQDHGEENDEQVPNGSVGK